MKFLGDAGGFDDLLESLEPISSFRVNSHSIRNCVVTAVIVNIVDSNGPMECTRTGGSLHVDMNTTCGHILLPLYYMP